MTLIIETQEQCKKCFHFQVCSSVLKNDLFIREVMLREKEPKCKMFVEVVLCKDCKWMEEFSGKDSGKPCGYGYCKNPIGLMGIAYNESYCSYGERKDND